MGKIKNQKFELSLNQLLPNMMTIAAICLGVTAIKHGFESKFESAGDDSIIKIDLSKPPTKPEENEVKEDNTKEIQKNVDDKKDTSN